MISDMYKMKYKNKIINLRDVSLLLALRSWSSNLTNAIYDKKVTSQTLAQSFVHGIIVPIDC